MRTLILLAALLVPAASSAVNVGGIVLSYECAVVDPEADGFSCLGTDTAGSNPILQLEIGDHSGASDRQKAVYQYRFGLLVLRFFQLGGRDLELTFAAKPGVRQRCWRRKESYSYWCNEPQ